MDFNSGGFRGFGFDDGFDPFDIFKNFFGNSGFSHGGFFDDDDDFFMENFGQ